MDLFSNELDDSQKMHIENIKIVSINVNNFSGAEAKPIRPTNPGESQYKDKQRRWNSVEKMNERKERAVNIAVCLKSNQTDIIILQEFENETDVSNEFMKKNQAGYYVYKPKAQFYNLDNTSIVVILVSKHLVLEATSIVPFESPEILSKSKWARWVKIGLPVWDKTISITGVHNPLDKHNRK